jgi:phosphocarrier protein FPr
LVGIVIVTHSAELAEGLCKLIEKTIQKKVPVAAAGGIDDPEHPFGTDALKIQKAIESVYSDEGVVVLMDMGSAILSAETALDLLGEDRRSRVSLCEAPLVEGALSAAVQSEIGGSLQQVVSEARGALTPKMLQLQDTMHEAPSQLPPETPPAAKSRRLSIKNRLGLHSRPAARFVSLAARYESEISAKNLTRDTEAVSAKSINQIATLGLRKGQELLLTASGPDAETALGALTELVENDFDEPAAIDEPEKSSRHEKDGGGEGEITGLPASPGIALGPVAHFRLHPVESPIREKEEPEKEWLRLERALESVRREIERLKERTVALAGENEAAIFEAQLLSLEDPALVGEAREGIFGRGEGAETSWQSVLDGMIHRYRSLEDPYMRARSADLVSVKEQVLQQLQGVDLAPLELSGPSVIVADDLAPSDILGWDTEEVLGIGTAGGSVASHSAILARSLGIPAVVGLGSEVLKLHEGILVALDGQKGRVWINPKEPGRFEKRRGAWLASQKELRASGRLKPQTRDGRLIEIGANVQGIADVRSALSTYRAIAKLLGPRFLIIRTFDLGGDKNPPYLELPPEGNPFLGRRGIRLSLDHIDLLKTQLRAILRASSGNHIKVMFPMIATVDEVLKAKGVLSDARLELAGAPFDESLEVGIMVEVPSAVAIADRLAVHVDFFSIGSNDLSQYVMAADRTNRHVGPLADSFHPAVLRMIHQTVKAARDAGISVGLCGEMAGDTLATPLLVGLGIDELSMNPPSIPAVKKTITQMTLREAEGMAAQALGLDSADKVRELVSDFLQSGPPE